MKCPCCKEELEYTMCVSSCVQKCWITPEGEPVEYDDTEVFGDGVYHCPHCDYILLDIGVGE
jgi:hypothetical protein